MGDLDRFRGLLGVAAILGVAWLCSEDRRRISPRMVLGGLAMQVVFGLVLLKSATGRAVLAAAARWVDTVLACTDAGSRFVFGDKLVDPAGPAGFVFAFRVLPTIVFVAALFAVLYHLGIMQQVVRAFAWVTTKILGSSGAETLNAAASIFLGQTEAPLVIRPYLPRLTRSELAVVMVSGMGLVSGGILGAYAAAGCDLRDLLTAIFMSFPATIFLTKMFIPETGVPETLGTLHVSRERLDANVLDAAARGTREGLLLAANVGAILIAFIALVALVNLMLGWIGGLTGGPELSLQRLLGFVLAPCAWLIGVPLEDCRAVGGLLGTRTVLNELIAYFDMGRMKDTLSPKAFSLATIAMCSFANISSIGIQLGGIGTLVPERRGDLAGLGVKMLVISTLANALSAAIAGLLMG
jgi:CNT family concentrative nucleoside transporter